METWETGKPFEETVRARDGITGKIDEKTLRTVFELDNFVKEVDTIFERLV
jgi:adenylosuccinate lyase